MASLRSRNGLHAVLLFLVNDGSEHRPQVALLPDQRILRCVSFHVLFEGGAEADNG